MGTSIIDTHLHLVYRDRLSYPWLADVAPLDRDFHYETYAVEARRCGVTDALHMEVDVAPNDIEAETRNVAGLAAQPGSLLRATVSSCRPEDSGFPAFLERQLADLFVKGFRRVLHFVLDHCGIPAIKDRAEHPWREKIAEIAKRPNVAVKVSGVVAYADPMWTVDDIQPYVEHAIASFGWDRVVWGSDWPVCTLTASLSMWMAATHAITLGCSMRARAPVQPERATHLAPTKLTDRAGHVLRPDRWRFLDRPDRHARRPRGSSGLERGELVLRGFSKSASGSAH